MSQVVEDLLMFERGEPAAPLLQPQLSQPAADHCCSQKFNHFYGSGNAFGAPKCAGNPFWGHSPVNQCCCRSLYYPHGGCIPVNFINCCGFHFCTPHFVPYFCCPKLLCAPQPKCCCAHEKTDDKDADTKTDAKSTKSTEDDKKEDEKGEDEEGKGDSEDGEEE